jgi:PAS domain S-box-containing protein
MIHSSIRLKLVAIVMATTCASLCVMGLALGAFELVSHRRAMMAELAAVGDIIGANSTAALTFNDQDVAKEILRALEPQHDIRLACLYDARGRLFSSFSRPAERMGCPSSPTSDGAAFEGGVFVQSEPVMLQAERIGTLRLVASQHTLWRHMRLFALVLALTVIVSALGALLLSSRLQRLVSRPILELATTARRVTQQRDYALRAPQHSTDEVGVAVGAFNLMLDQVQGSDLALRQAEQQSREQAQFLGSILDNMGEGMVVIDPAAEVLLWNAAATRILGPSPQGLPLADWARHFKLGRVARPGQVAHREPPLARALRGEDMADYEMTIEADEGRNECWVTGTARPLRDERGKVVGAIAVFRDVTQQRKAELGLKATEAQLLQAQKMDAVGQLAGGIAHDFNNLLTVICGFSDFALKQIPAGSPARSDIEEVMNAGQRASTLTRQLLAFSRKQVLAPQRLDLNAAVHGSRQLLRRLIGEDVEFVAVYGANLSPVLADPGQIDQVILNLVVNARDAMPQGGRLTVETDNVELDEQSIRNHPGAHTGWHVRLKVSDTGVGMSEEVQSRIFEPFFSTKAVGRGTGLGLSTVYGIVQQTGGHIEVSSTPGKGTTFSIYLPAATARSASAAPDLIDGLPAPGGTETILLVEDEAAVRSFARRILTGFGYEVLVATDGVEALEIQARYGGQIHLLISDVVMPRMGGWELARALLQKLPGLRVVFFSGYAAELNIHPSFPVEELVLISKPFTAGTLARAVREALDRCRAA